MNAVVGFKVFRWQLASLSINVDVASLFADDSPARPAAVRGVKKISNLWVKGMTA